MKWWWKKLDRCKYGGGGCCTAIFRMRGVPHRRAWHVLQLEKQPRAMAAMSPLSAAPASSERTDQMFSEESRLRKEEEGHKEELRLYAPAVHCPGSKKGWGPLPAEPMAVLV